MQHACNVLVSTEKVEAVGAVVTDLLGYGGTDDDGICGLRMFGIIVDARNNL